MKKSIVFGLLLFSFSLLVLFTSNCGEKAVNEETALGQGPSTNSTTQASNTTACAGTSKNKFCADNSDGICPMLPTDVEGVLSFGYNSDLNPSDQPPFDIFSWQSFIALNWPADENGQAMGDFNDHPNAERVWEHFISADKLMNEEPSAVDKLESGLKDKDLKVFYMTSKSSGDPDLHDFLMIGGKPLIDRNLNFVNYEQKVNPVEADFIRKHKLTTKEGIYTFANGKETIALPPNSEVAANSIEIKASWRIVDAKYGDDLSKYYTKQAVIHVPAANSTTGESFQINCTVGMVGMHLITKTKNFEDWIWSTFEHIDNVPNDPQQAQNGQDNQQWSFYNPACLNCPVNTPPDVIASEDVYKWSPEAPHAARYATKAPSQKMNGALGYGTQVTRLFPIYYCTEEINKLWQQKLGKSVFANYQLIGSQWVKNNPEKAGLDAPALLANVTAETYKQPTSSCLSCHNHARIKYNDQEIKTDFSFVLAGAN